MQQVEGFIERNRHEFDEHRDDERIKAESERNNLTMYNVGSEAVNLAKKKGVARVEVLPMNPELLRQESETTPFVEVDGKHFAIRALYEADRSLGRIWPYFYPRSVQLLASDTPDIRAAGAYATAGGDIACTMDIKSELDPISQDRLEAEREVLNLVQVVRDAMTNPFDLSITPAVAPEHQKETLF